MTRWIAGWTAVRICIDGRNVGLHSRCVCLSNNESTYLVRDLVLVASLLERPI